MNAFRFIFLLSLLTFFSKAQSDIYIKVIKNIQQNYPEINLSNKLLAVNVWSESNLDSWEANKQFDKVYKIYDVAKLKGGTKGLICVAINKEGENASVILNNNGITKLIQLSKIDASLCPISNYVFDDQGKEVYKNILPDKIFESMHKLITR